MNRDRTALQEIQRVLTEHRRAEVEENVAEAIRAREAAEAIQAREAAEAIENEAREAARQVRLDALYADYDEARRLGLPHEFVIDFDDFRALHGSSWKTFE